MSLSPEWHRVVMVEFLLNASHIPQVDAIVCPARRQNSSVTAKGQRVDSVVVGSESGDSAAGSQVPKEDHLVRSGRHEISATVREGECVDLRFVASQVARALPVQNVPEADRAI